MLTKHLFCCRSIFVHSPFSLLHLATHLCSSHSYPWLSYHLPHSGYLCCSHMSTFQSRVFTTLPLPVFVVFPSRDPVPLCCTVVTTRRTSSLTFLPLDGAPCHWAPHLNSPDYWFLTYCYFLTVPTRPHVILVVSRCFQYGVISVSCLFLYLLGLQFCLWAHHTTKIAILFSLVFKRCR